MLNFFNPVLISKGTLISWTGCFSKTIYSYHKYFQNKYFGKWILSWKTEELLLLIKHILDIYSYPSINLDFFLFKYK